MRFVVGPVPFALAALNGTVYTPPTVGVPLITPVPVLSVKPSGRPEAEKLVGPLLAVRV
jgi:hypothetical protein